MMWLFKLALGSLSTIIGPVFNWLNARVDADSRKHISDNDTLARVGSTIIDGTSKADELNAAIRLKEGVWSPWVIVTIVGFMTPFAWHTWQVVLDSSRWLPVIETWYGLPYLTVIDHRVGSWSVAALPGMFETTEHAVINSLFIGASTLLAGHGLIKALKR